MKCYINDVNFIRVLLLSTELFEFEIQKYGQILRVHKPYFLMPGHILPVVLLHVILTTDSYVRTLHTYIMYTLFNCDVFVKQ